MNSNTLKKNSPGMQEQARLTAGHVMIDAGRHLEGTGSNNVEGHSDTVSLGTGTAASDVANLLDLSQEPMDVLWDGELVHVLDGDESLIAHPPQDDIIILESPSGTPQGVSLEMGTSRARRVTGGRIRYETIPPSQTASAASLIMLPPENPTEFCISRYQGRGAAQGTHMGERSS